MRIAVAATATGVLVVLLGLMFVLTSDGRDRRILFFPAVAAAGAGATGAELQLRQETRNLPPRFDGDGELRLLVEELILGPADHRAHRLLPRETTVLAVHVTGSRAYVNLSRHVLFGQTLVPTTAGDRLQVLARTIRANFPDLSTVTLLVEGQEPRIN